MRLLNVDSLEFGEFRDDERPKYAIASHRWVNGFEPTYQNFKEKRNVDSIGYKKVLAFAQYVKEHVASIDWLWIDTCCINKESSAELSESINLMFEWYRSAELCLAYIADVEAADDRGSFCNSEWFKRGWTLQELLAPRTIVFVTRTWRVIGNKGASCHGYTGTITGVGLERDIATVTGIPEEILHNYVASLGLSVDTRMKWIEGRNTTREEDMSYALYGIFGVTPGANYGEKHEGARQRLLAALYQKEHLTTQQAAQFRQITLWLSPPDPWTNHNSARQRHEPQTGAWLLCDRQYKAWKRGIDNSLWLYGKAGCGKTVLCSTAIEDVRKYCESSYNAGYAFFYFTFSDTQKQSYENLLRSLVVQLGRREPGLSMLRQAYEMSGQSVLETGELKKILRSSVTSYSEVFLLLDALDECPEDGDIRHDMLQYLLELSHEAPNLRILATSRELSDIHKFMKMLEAVPLSIATHTVDVDIRRYVSMQLLRDHRLSRLDSTTKTMIQDTISGRADGMFRWAYCQLQELKKFKSTKPQSIRAALSTLPATLDETYARILTSISDEDRSDALTMLRWLAYAKSPPSLIELAEAAIINTTADGTVEFDNRGDWGDSLEILAGLVTIDGSKEADVAYVSSNRFGSIVPTYWANSLEVPTGFDTANRPDKKAMYYEDAMPEASDVEEARSDVTFSNQCINKHTVVRLAHFSVKEYLQSERILESSARDFHLEIGKVQRFLAHSCLLYILHYSNSSVKTSTKQDIILFPLLIYAATSWFHHSRLQQCNEVSREVSFLNSNAVRDWLLLFDLERQSWGRFVGDPSPVGAGIYYASMLGLEMVVREYLNADSNFNNQGGQDHNALQAALLHGHEKIARMLIDAGADVNVQGQVFKTAIQEASSRGYDKIVRMLIDVGADVNAQGQGFETAIQEASSRGYDKIVRMLIDAGADVNAQEGFCNTALQEASFRGYDKIVRMLIDVGADVNAHRQFGSTALQAASVEGHDKIVRILIDAGADVNSQGGQFGSALQAASANGYQKIVQLLLGAGADVNIQGGEYHTALHAASCGGHNEVVQMLINAGADVYVQVTDCSTTLCAASWGLRKRILYRSW